MIPLFLTKTYHSPILLSSCLCQFKLHRLFARRNCWIKLRDRLRVKHYSLQTEKIYIRWVRRYILFNSKRHTKELGVVEVEAFLTHLAVVSQVSASTQN